MKTEVHSFATVAKVFQKKIRAGVIVVYKSIIKTLFATVATETKKTNELSVEQTRIVCNPSKSLL